VARVSKLTAFSSEIGDTRPLSSVSFAPDSVRLATASWTGSSKVWSIVPTTTCLFELKGHAGNVSDIAWRPAPDAGTSHADGVQLASCGMDSAVMLWKLPDNSATAADSNHTSMTDVASSSSQDNHINSNSSSLPPPATAESLAPTSLAGLPAPAVPVLAPAAVLRGHTERCSRVSFHPSGRFVASTSFDKTWRLWDLTTRQCVLTQPGHAEGTYALAFHPDGSLAVSGDLGGVGQLWDLRTGKSLAALTGHAKQMLAADFHPGGTLLATASDDHTVRVWDLRKQAGSLYTIGAHSSLISNVRWESQEGLFLLTSSYDQTVKLWHGTDFTLLKTLAGHEGKVMRADIAPNSAFIATSAFDRTWKLYAYEQ
jgi:U4/U6 small nuclear ribonucleoprotein PRP4